MSAKEEILKFSLEIERIANQSKISHMDAILFYCEKNGFEVEVAAKLISKALKSKIKLEAETLNFLPKPKSKKLPV